MYCLNFNKDDIQFIKENYVGIYSLLKARLSKYDEEYIWKSDNEANYRGKIVLLMKSVKQLVQIVRSVIKDYIYKKFGINNNKKKKRMFLKNSLFILF